jgi:hypothetical protein
MGLLLFVLAVLVSSSVGTSWINMSFVSPVVGNVYTGPGDAAFNPDASELLIVSQAGSGYYNRTNPFLRVKVGPGGSLLPNPVYHPGDISRFFLFFRFLSVLFTF